MKYSDFKLILEEQLLNEMFNRPYETELVYNGPHHQEYLAHTDDGRQIEINISYEDVDHIILNNMGAFDSPLASRHGWNPDHVFALVGFEVDGTIAVTGKGDAGRIFATVFDAMEEAMATNRNIVGFMFTSEGMSRSRLYNTMIRVMGKKGGLKTIVSSKHGTGSTAMTFSLLGHKRKAPYLFMDQVFEETLNESYLTELFDRPYRWRTANLHGRDVADATMQTGNATYVFKTDEGDSVMVEFNEDLDEEGEVFTAEFRRQGSYGVTGRGDAPKIFATVIDIMKHFVQEVHPDMLKFSADVDFKSTGVPGEAEENRSRIKLYSRMIQRFARRLGYQYSSKPMYNGTSQEYYIWK